MKWGIVVDSSSDLLSNYVSENDIDFTVVPLKIRVDDIEYVDDDNARGENIVSALNQMKKNSGSSCPSVGDFAAAYDKSEQVFCFTISQHLSGTFNTARLAIENTEKNPKVDVYDSYGTGGSIILLVDKAVELIKQGLSFEEATEILHNYSESMRLYFTLSNYTNLIKNGRMSAFAGHIAQALKIRAISHADGGVIQVIKKCRGDNKALNEIAQLMGDKVSSNTKVIIDNCMFHEGAQYLKEKLLEMYNITNVRIIDGKYLTGYYQMDGGLIVSYNLMDKN
ncbi:MAG: DegV family protein [Erysipelotrichaceae bacterium]